MIDKKKSQAFMLRLRTFLQSKVLPSTLTLSSKIPVGNNANCVRIESHKNFAVSFMPRISRFVKFKSQDSGYLDFNLSPET